MIEALLRAIRGGSRGANASRGSDDDSPAFIRGLALGAFVGAAIAGSTVWRRFHGGSRALHEGPDSTTGTAAAE